MLFGALILALTIQSTAQPAPGAAEVTAQAQAILASIVAGDYTRVEEQFTPQMKAALPAGRLAAMWKGLLTQAGAHTRCTENVRVRRISDKRMVITRCEFERAAFDIQFAFDASGRISGLNVRRSEIATGSYEPPPYVAPTYEEEETSIGSGEWVLPATLTLPRGRNRVPAVVLVHGSGPQDRDTTIAGNKPFKDLALGLASRGIAVLRYDKRSKVHAAKLSQLGEFTVKEAVIDDVSEALRALRAHPRIDDRRLFVLGHSLGGMLIPRIAKSEPAVAGFIVMAGAARPIEDVILEQMQYLAAADGTISSEEQQAIDATAARAREIRALTPERAKTSGPIAGLPASYWLDLRGYDPASAAKSVTAPMLILQGERDYQVTADDFARWRAALPGRTDVTFRSYAALNHLFIAGSRPSVPAEYLIAGHVAEDVVRDIATWVLERR